DLGQQPHLPLAPQCRGEPARRRRVLRAPTKLRGPAPEGADLGMFDSHDAVENVVLRCAHTDSLRFGLPSVTFASVAVRTQTPEASGDAQWRSRKSSGRSWTTSRASWAR